MQRRVRAAHPFAGHPRLSFELKRHGRTLQQAPP
jgi:hypothetical protein